MTRQLFQITIITSCLFLLIEAASRVYLHFNSNDYRSYDQALSYNHEPNLFEAHNYNGTEYLESSFFPTRYYSQIKDKRGKLIRKHKLNTSFRIFFFGGSTTAGSPFGHWGSFARMSEDILNQAKHPNVEIEVINFGTSKFGSSKMLRLLQRSLHYEPDLLVIYSGHNELCDSYRQIQQIGKAQSPLPILNFIVSKSSTMEILLKIKRRYNFHKTLFMENICEQIKVTKEGYEYLKTTYAKNIEQIASITKSTPAKVLLITPFPTSTTLLLLHPIKKNTIWNFRFKRARALQQTLFF